MFGELGEAGEAAKEMHMHCWQILCTSNGLLGNWASRFPGWCVRIASALGVAHQHDQQNRPSFHRQTTKTHEKISKDRGCPFGFPSKQANQEHQQKSTRTTQRRKPNAQKHANRTQHTACTKARATPPSLGTRALFSITPPRPGPARARAPRRLCRP